ncbi:MAG: hypothetical protein AVDCRST_MAG42-1697 [uncultured Chthoniobacterales bacterium]|uniref:DUF541 domain-containing protein n=1 Tax=uncultured Chthoniobacterales bacterium TaxID=1836801 RepID=A0A6J4I5A2_9BACT|nr:MAG: hypothetical protein AVDCRST_MAG42-1697 [uncultured Chthoniobacterales bacterium]
MPVSLCAEAGLPNQPYVYVEGKSEVERMADMVTLRFDLVARNADQSKANQEVQAKAGKILALLNDRKIAHGDVIAEDLKSEPQYEDEESSSNRRGKVIGYSVTRSFEVKVRDVATFPKLVDELLALGGVEFSAIDGGLANEKEMQDDVFAKALIDARTRAEKTLALTGMKIDSLFAVSPVRFLEIRQKVLGGHDAYGSATTERVVVPDPMQYRLAPVAVTQSVHLIFLISPAK